MSTLAMSELAAKRSISLRTSVGIALIALTLLAGLIGLIAPPFDPIEPDLLARLQPPSAEHWLGTDQFGRDVLSRVLAGAISSIAISLGSVGFAVLLGMAIGAAAGYFGGNLDRGIGFLTDALMAFPGILLALGLTAVFGPSRMGVILALGVAFTPSVVRSVRAAALSVSRNQFVEAASAMGHSHAWIIARHILPNCMSPLIVLATTLVGVALLAESALSFLGLGVPPPSATWGGMLAESRSYLDKAMWLALCPGAAISLALLGINLAGDALRDHLDPRMKQR
jgi:peptide/nickel transport system permease protein